MDPTKKRKIDENGAAATDGDASPLLLSPDDARKMIEPLSKDQLIDILKDAVVRHPDVLDSVRTIADPDITNRKLFIRGLGWETTTEGLRSLFSSYGELEEAVVILDKNTGKSKGYGFVTFKHVDGALLALKEPSKKIDGRVTVTQLAAAGNQGNNVNSADVSMRKIYVANVPFDMPSDKLLSLFAQYGEIEEGPLGFDKATGKSRGFALFVYKTAEGAQAALVEPVKNIDGRQLSCKLAIDGKKKPGQGGSAGGPGDGHGDGMGMMSQPSMPGSMAGQYGGPGGMGSYGGYSGGPPPMGHHLNSAGPGMGSQPPSSMGGTGGYGSGMGGGYGGFGGPGATGYGGFGGASAGGLGGPAGGMGGAGGGYGGPGGLGGAGAASSLYKMPPGSVGMPSAGYPDGTHYSMPSSAAYPSQLNQPSGASPAPRVPTGGGMYPNVPPYY